MCFIHTCHLESEYIFRNNVLDTDRVVISLYYISTEKELDFIRVKSRERILRLVGKK